VNLVRRHLDWEGCFNARDLGGLRTVNGRVTRWGAVVRSDNLGRLAPSGWEAVQAYGVRTIVDLRNDDERRELPSPPQGITTVHVPLDDDADIEFWTYIWDNELDGTPLYFRPFLDRKPERCVAAITAVAWAEPGGVVIHCGGGRDRTGLITMLLLALTGVEPGDIAADYESSNERLPPFWAELGMPDQREEIEDILARKRTTARAELLATLGSFDTADHLRSAGLNNRDLRAVRDRLLEPPGHPGSE
jgi:protein tyrosine/serine phosphatase